MVIRFREEGKVYKVEAVQIGLKPKWESNSLKYSIPELGEVVVSRNDIKKMLKHFPDLIKEIKNEK